MRRVGLVSALALVVLVDAAVLAGVVWNRSGSPDAKVTLTERELPLKFGGPRESTGIALGLVMAPATHAPAWFDEAKLRELGFQPERHPIDGDTRAGRWPLPRRAYAVLELDGPAWSARLEQEQRTVDALPELIAAGKGTEAQLESARRRLAHLRESASRLIAVDAGPDPDVLRARYPDRARYVISAAEVRMHYGPRWSATGARSGPRVQGHIGRILPSSLHVPVQFHPALKEITARSRGTRAGPYGDAGSPRYRATVHYGARNEPWIVDLQRIP